MAVGASKILTMLPSTPQVEAVYLDPHSGILAGLHDLPPDTDSHNSSLLDGSNESAPHTILIDQTTLDPTFAVTLAEKIQSETLGRVQMLDAPVSGGEHRLWC